MGGRSGQSVTRNTATNGEPKSVSDRIFEGTKSSNFERVEYIKDGKNYTSLYKDENGNTIYIEKDGSQISYEVKNNEGFTIIQRSNLYKTEKTAKGIENVIKDKTENLIKKYNFSNLTRDSARSISKDLQDELTQSIKDVKRSIFLS